MNRYFVTYEQALALKELGFNEPCFGVFDYNTYPSSIPEHLLTKGILTLYGELFEKEEFEIQPKDLVNSNIGGDISAPLKVQVFEWFREKHKLHVNFPFIDEIIKYGYIITNVNSNTEIAEEYSYDFEEAENACIDKLIELIKL